MRAFKTIPYCSVRAAKLSKGALSRLVWIDWYFAHGRKARAAMRHFNLSPTVFYRWMRRYKKYDLRSIEDDTSTRRPKHTRAMTTSRQTIDIICTIRANDLEKSKYEIQAEMSASSASAADFLHKVVSCFTFPVEAIQTDNGSEYLLNFHKTCEETGIIHYFS